MTSRQQKQDMLINEVLVLVKSSPIPLTLADITRRLSELGDDRNTFDINKCATQAVASLLENREIVETRVDGGAAYESALHSQIQREFAPFD